MIKVVNIRRFQNGNGYYYVQVDTTGVQVPGCPAQMVYLPLYTIKRDDNKSVYILYDNDGNSIYEFYKYLNSTIFNYSESVRGSTAYSLRYLYICSCIFSTNVTKEDITSEFLSTVASFIKGKYSEHGIMCSDDTVNRRLSSIERYLECIGIHVKRFSRSNSLPSERGTSSSSSASLQRPPYISIAEFNRLLIEMKEHPRKTFPAKFLRTVEKENRKVSELNAYLKKKNPIEVQKIDETGILIISLMFRYGLRIGEVLGLTKEDITKRAYNGEQRYTIYIRNRMSDDPKSQSAKNKRHPRKSEDYDSVEYKGDGGTSKVRVTKEMYDELIRYFNEYTMILAKTFPDNNLKADSIDGHTDNYYLFANVHGNRMLQPNWNNILRAYFKKADIAVDKEKKETNLNHKFRHSFAMMFVQVLNLHNKQNPDKPPLGLAELSVALRHKPGSLDTCRKYFTWTEEREKEVLEELDAEFIRDCPDVAEIFNRYTETKPNTNNKQEKKTNAFQQRINQLLNEDC